MRAKMKLSYESHIRDEIDVVTGYSSKLLYEAEMLKMMRRPRRSDDV
jgi:hypothetical protein|eukprot:COSAG06_NODE_27761_length_587_cov_0.620902_2_plen_47_part_00